MKELLFSLSKDKGDFVVQPFKGSGNGGQKRNKTMSACRISHPASGAVSECQEERSYEQNKKKAFRRLLEKSAFTAWHRLECGRRMGTIANIEDQVEAEMKHVLVETVRDGKWVELTKEMEAEHENP